MRWNGFQGAPGYSNFFYGGVFNGTPTQTDAENAAQNVFSLGGYVRSFLPAEVSLQVQTDVEVVDEATGELQTVHNVAPRATLPGEAASAPYSAASGAVITWRTGGVRNGRRVRGRTFLVPLATAAYQSDGTLAASTITALTTNLNTFLNPPDAIEMGIYARPSVKGASDGAWFAATGFSVPDKVAVLRSRRD